MTTGGMASGSPANSLAPPVEVVLRDQRAGDGALLGGEQPAGVVRRREVDARLEALDPLPHPAAHAEQGDALRPQLPRLVVGAFAVVGDDRPEPVEPAEVVGALHIADATRLRLADGRVCRRSPSSEPAASAAPSPTPA